MIGLPGDLERNQATSACCSEVLIVLAHANTPHPALIYDSKLDGTVLIVNQTS